MSDISIRRRFDSWQSALADTDVSADVCNKKRALFYDELSSAYREGRLIAPTPEALATSPEVQTLIAAAETRGWNEAIEAAAGHIVSEAERLIDASLPSAPGAMNYMRELAHEVRSLKKGE